MKNLFLVICLFMIGTLFAQRDINSYENVIVPIKFDFFKKNNQYNLNTLTKMFFVKMGFKTYLDNEMPEEIYANPCNNLYVNVAETGNFLKTKIQVFLSDCKKDTLYKSEIGISKEKDINVSYNLALRAALKSFEKINYQYTPNTPNSNQSVAPLEEVKKIEEKTEKKHTQLTVKNITNGFELINSDGLTIMKLLKTSRSDTYTAFKSGQQGALILKDKTWFFEYYQGEQFVSEPVEVEIPN